MFLNNVIIILADRISVSYEREKKSLLLCFILKMSFGWRGRERQRFQLFESASYGWSDLLFKDVTEKLLVLMEDMDMSQVLGLDYVALLKGLGHEGERLLPLCAI